MEYQYAQKYTDLMIGDIVEIDSKCGKLYDIRMIQTIKDSKVYFEFKLENTDWVKRDQVKVIEKID